MYCEGETPQFILSIVLSLPKVYHSYMKFTSSFVKVTAQPDSHSGEVPMSDFICRHSSTYAAFSPAGRLSISIFQSCMLPRNLNPAVTTILFYPYSSYVTGRGGFSREIAITP